MTPRLDRILAIRLVAHDPDRLARFYAEALGAQVGELHPIPPAEAALVGEGQRRTLRLGSQCLDLDAFSDPGAPYPSDVAADDTRFQHVAVVTAGIEAAYERARLCGASAISRDGPVRLPPASGGAIAVKLRDPEGHPFELITLTGGAWDGVTPNGRGVRGLDHSAITVRDVAASRRFYADLGLVERDATVNRGPEQAALDGLDAPEVDVAPLFPSEDSPHLELLRYRTSTPPTARALGDRDVVATRIAWSHPGVEAPMLLRDPDGHRHFLAAP